MCPPALAAQCRDKVSLRSLSMVVRHLDEPGTAQQVESSKQSVKYAEQAVQLDVKDGQSWGGQRARMCVCVCVCVSLCVSMSTSDVLLSLQLPWAMRTCRYSSWGARMLTPCNEHGLRSQMR